MHRHSSHTCNLHPECRRRDKQIYRSLNTLSATHTMCLSEKLLFSAPVSQGLQGPCADTSVLKSPVHCTGSVWPCHERQCRVSAPMQGLALGTGVQKPKRPMFRIPLATEVPSWTVPKWHGASACHAKSDASACSMWRISSCFILDGHFGLQILIH